MLKKIYYKKKYNFLILKEKNPKKNYLREKRLKLHNL
jgi:hypothetical protein